MAAALTTVLPLKEKRTLGFVVSESSSPNDCGRNLSDCSTGYGIPRSS